MGNNVTVTVPSAWSDATQKGVKGNFVWVVRFAHFLNWWCPEVTSNSERDLTWPVSWFVRQKADVSLSAAEVLRTNVSGITTKRDVHVLRNITQVTKQCTHLLHKRTLFKWLPVPGPLLEVLALTSVTGLRLLKSKLARIRIVLLTRKAEPFCDVTIYELVHIAQRAELPYRLVYKTHFFAPKSGIKRRGASYTWVCSDFWDTKGEIII